MASILVVAGKDRGAYYPLGKNTLVAGRDETCDIQILDDLVSRRHLEIRHDARSLTYRIKDLNSSNGVFINARQISRETELQDGDTIRIGETKLFYTDKEFPDMEAAMTAFKKRGEHGKSTLIQ